MRDVGIRIAENLAKEDKKMRVFLEQLQTDYSTTLLKRVFDFGCNPSQDDKVDPEVPPIYL